jgi:hypothetical protein
LLRGPLGLGLLRLGLGKGVGEEATRSESFFGQGLVESAS